MRPKESIKNIIILYQEVPPTFLQFHKNLPLHPHTLKGPAKLPKDAAICCPMPFHVYCIIPPSTPQSVTIIFPCQFWKNPLYQLLSAHPQR